MNKIATLKHIRNLYNAAKGFRRIKLAAYTVNYNGVYDADNNRVDTHGTTGKYGYAWWNKDKWDNGYTDDAELAQAMHNYNSTYNTHNYKQLQNSVGTTFTDTPMTKEQYDAAVASKYSADRDRESTISNPKATTTTAPAQPATQPQQKAPQTTYVKYTPGVSSEYNLTADEAGDNAMVVSKALQQVLNAGMGIDEHGNYNPAKYAKPETAGVTAPDTSKAASYKHASKAMPNAFNYIRKMENR